MLCHQFCSTCTANALPRKLWKGLETSKYDGKSCILKYADDLVLLAKEEKMLQDMIDKLIEIERCYGMEMNVEKNKSNENFKTTIPSKNYDRPKKLENMESFKYLGSMLTNDGRFTCEIKSGIAMAKAAFNKKRALFTSTLDLKLRKKPVKCYTWSMALYGAETWRLWAVDHKYVGTPT